LAQDSVQGISLVAVPASRWMPILMLPAAALYRRTGNEARRTAAGPLLPAAALRKRAVQFMALPGRASHGTPAGGLLGMPASPETSPGLEESPASRRAASGGATTRGAGAGQRPPRMPRTPLGGSSTHRSGTSTVRHYVSPVSWHASKVKFGSPLYTSHDVTPYEEYYGRHPSLFNFDAAGNMVPVGMSPMGMSPGLSPGMSPSPLYSPDKLSAGGNPVCTAPSWMTTEVAMLSTPAGFTLTVTPPPADTAMAGSPMHREQPGVGAAS